MSFIIFDGTFLLWLIYGNKLFYSTSNHCNEAENSQILYNLMLVLLIVGYFQMLMYGFVILCLPLIICYLWRAQGPQTDLSDQTIPKVLRKLTVTKFNPERFRNDENTCSICYVEYQMEDDVTPLSCNPNHYFHTKCIEEWIKRGHNSCPLCRLPIRDLNNLSVASDEEAIRRR